MILAQKAARKHPKPPTPIKDTKNAPEINVEDDWETFATKIMPSGMTTQKCKEKILSKMDESEIQLQLYILLLVDQLNELLADKKPVDLFSNGPCKVKYTQLMQLQRSQAFSAIGWKVVPFPVLMPMTNTTRIFVAPVFHTRSLQIFQNWSLGNNHCDVNLSPSGHDNFVEQQEGCSLDEIFPHEIFANPNWPIIENLEKSLKSEEPRFENRAEEKALFNDSIGVNSDVSENSLLDFSFIGVPKPSNPPKRQNLSRVDQLKILEAGGNNVHSTPRQRSYSVGNVPKSPLSKGPTRNLSQSLKRTEKPKMMNEGYLAQFLKKWFRSNMNDLTVDLQSEMEKLENQS